MITLIPSLILSCSFLITEVQIDEPPVKASFEKLDLYCVNDLWNHAKEIKDNPNKILDVDVQRNEVVSFGIYTTQNMVMKMTAQLFPLYPYEIREVCLELKKNEK